MSKRAPFGAVRLLFSTIAVLSSLICIACGGTQVGPDPVVNGASLKTCISCPASAVLINEDGQPTHFTAKVTRFEFFISDDPNVGVNGKNRVLWEGMVEAAKDVQPPYIGWTAPVPPADQPNFYDFLYQATITAYTGSSSARTSTTMAGGASSTIPYGSGPSTLGTQGFSAGMPGTVLNYIWFEAVSGGIGSGTSSGGPWVAPPRRIALGKIQVF